MGRRSGMARAAAAGLVLAVVAAGLGCKLQNTTAPALVGPSEFGVSLQIQANPDVLFQDGVSQARITIDARDANGGPIGSLTLLVETAANGQIGQFGRLSSNRVVTGSNGRAEVTFTAPSLSIGSLTGVIILVTPIGDNFQNAVSRQISIALLPPGGGNAPPIASFTFTQPAEEGTPITFDGSASFDPDGLITAFSWSFGDGSTDSGPIVTHTFSRVATFTVTLTVVDDRGFGDVTSQDIEVGEVAGPTASFVFSPTEPAVEQRVFFNASGSTAEPGREIVKFSWDFGDGGKATGITVSHRFDVAGTFTVTLTVTDDAGKQHSLPKDVPVTEAEGGLFADFTFSPTDPAPGDTVFFNASDSTSERPIVSFKWDFGDGDTDTETDATTSHVFDTAGTFVVRLTITDSAGNTATTTKDVVVEP